MAEMLYRANQVKSLLHQGELVGYEFERINSYQLTLFSAPCGRVAWPGGSS